MDPFDEYQDRKMRRQMGPEAIWVYFATSILLILILRWWGLFSQ